MVPGRLHLGSVQLVNSVIMIGVGFKEHSPNDETSQKQTSEVPNFPFFSSINNLNLGNLTTHEKNEEEHHVESDDEILLQLVQHHDYVMDDETQHDVQNENTDDDGTIQEDEVIHPEDKTVQEENETTPNQSSGEEEQVEQVPERRQRRPRRVFTYDVVDLRSVSYTTNVSKHRAVGIRRISVMCTTFIAFKSTSLPVQTNIPFISTRYSNYQRYSGYQQSPYMYYSY